MCQIFAKKLTVLCSVGVFDVKNAKKQTNTKRQKAEKNNTKALVVKYGIIEENMRIMLDQRHRSTYDNPNFTSTGETKHYKGLQRTHTHIKQQALRVKTIKTQKNLRICTTTTKKDPSSFVI